MKLFGDLQTDRAVGVPQDGALQGSSSAAGALVFQLSGSVTLTQVSIALILIFIFPSFAPRKSDRRGILEHG